MAIGVAVTVLLLGAVYISYNANKSIPWKSRYHLTVAVPDAQRIAPTNDVRIAGVRVGQVSSVRAVAGGDRRPSVLLELSLEKDQGPLPADTRVAIRPASILGSTYVELAPGRATRSIADGGRLPLSASTATVELTDLLDMFDRSTRRSIRTVLGGVSDGLAGRGGAVNTSLQSVNRLLPPLERIGRTLNARATRLGALVTAADDLSGALAPVATDLSAGFASAGTTFGALARNRAALGATLDRLAPAERATTRALTRVQPALDDLGVLSLGLRRATGRLSGTLRSVNDAAAAGVPAAAQLRPFSRRLGPVFDALARLDDGSRAVGGIRSLSRLTDATGGTLDVFLPAQVHCNFIPLWANALGGVFSAAGGTRGGPLFTAVGFTHLGTQNEVFQNASPSPDAGINYVPHANANECESGNEVYDGRQHLNNPPGNQSSSTRATAPPAGVTELGRKAGLLEPGAGG
ncbi:MAG: Mammalian cell entry related domain protein [Conexibacter sp.]|nr:Mammalian cell entry related domain protein [Conexibacter sp.]